MESFCARPLSCRACPRCRFPFRCRWLLFAIFTLPAALAAQAGQPGEAVQFRLYDNYLIIVQTLVNGTGPFGFLLDTGTSRTIIDPALANRLRAPVVGNTSLTGILHVRQDELVQLQSIQLGTVSLSEMPAIVDRLSRQKTLAPGIRGVVGEDFLSRFDVLIDYKHRRLRFGGPIPSGERCPFETAGQYHGSPTSRRLLIPVQLVDMNEQTMKLQLDSGAKVLELFPGSFHARSSPPWAWSESTAANSVNGAAVHSNVTIRIGTIFVRGLDMIQSRRALAFDAGGLLPASIFQRIYISHSGGFVVLNPSD